MADRIAPRSGVAFTLRKGQFLKVTDPEGEQVCDLLAFSAESPAEQISSGRSIDYASRIYLTAGDAIYSSRSRVLLRIIDDTVGRHDFMLTPCSADTFRIIYGDSHPHHGCQGNFEKALAPYGISADQIPVAFNIFMNVALDGSTGEIKVLPPRSKAGDYIVFLAETDLIIALTACSAPQSNNGSFKPIDYELGEIAVVEPRPA
jgi:uncharacterized protein YcgI (DUF1989 family)